MTYRIAHYSDPHLDGGNEDDRLRLQGLFQKLHEHGVDHLIVTGDISDHGDREAFALLDRIRRESGFGPARSTVLPGNHDLPGWEHYWRRFGSCLNGTRSLHGGCIKLVSLDTTYSSWVPHDAPGALEPEARNSLERKLRGLARGAAATVVALHHHVINVRTADGFVQKVGRALGVWGPLEDSEEFRGLMQEYNVTLVLSGHLHARHSRQVSGVRYSIGGWRDGFWFYDFDGAALSGYGWVDLCDACCGRGLVVCEECDDDGEVECATCDGEQEVECEDCDGDGAVECPDCDGDDDECATCDGDGEVACASCQGSGAVACPDCDGGGYVACEECDGVGERHCNCAD